MKIKIGILGATGYTGTELLRLLVGHPHAEIKWLTSEKFANQKISDVFPTLRNFIDLKCKSVRELVKFENADLVFSCLPYGTSMHFAKLFVDKGAKFIDFSADLRFNNTKLGNQAIYGLPELFRNKIKKADLVANPGCYATAAILGLAPLLKNKLIELEPINIDAKAGLSGGGRAPVGERQFSEANDNISVNSISDHNQKPEIEEQMNILYETKPGLVFSAYNINIDRGILTTITVKLKDSATKSELLSKYRKFYKNENFIRIIDNEKNISTKNVRFTNYCDIGVNIQNGHVICITAIDNLGKGASGQAVQNMNLMFNLEESSGLLNLGLYP
jgi:N-acetyl-gamma-glutamyl-phosphate reductase